MPVCVMSVGFKTCESVLQTQTVPTRQPSGPALTHPESCAPARTRDGNPQRMNDVASSAVVLGGLTGWRCESKRSSSVSISEITLSSGEAIMYKWSEAGVRLT